MAGCPRLGAMPATRRALVGTLLAALGLSLTLAGCGGSSTKASAPTTSAGAPPSAPTTSAGAPSVADVSSCLMQSSVRSLIQSVTLVPDPTDNYNSNVLRIETTVAPGQYEGDQGALAVLDAASQCGADDLHVAMTVIDRNGTDMGQ
jgi:hypothetical protein